MSVLMNLAVLAAESPGPRGDNPSEGGGLLIIAGVIVAVMVIAALGVLLVNRFGVRQMPRRSRRPRS